MHLPTFTRCLSLVALAAAALPGHGQTAVGIAPPPAMQNAVASAQPLYALAQQQQGALLDTLKALVEIESGSGDREGLDRISQWIHDRLAALGGAVSFVEPTGDADRLHDTPERIGRMVKATFTGTGTAKVLLIAHMDTVYLKGMGAQQPFRIDANRAYGLGIGDDKAGVAVILHTLAVLKAAQARDYGTLTVLINGDEEISSPGSRRVLSQLGAQHDLTLSFEGTGVGHDQLSLATAGIAAVTLKVTGRASHAGAAPERGVNALYELSHQILQMRDLSDPTKGVKVNWTVAQAGANRNVIPAYATAAADVRVVRVADYDGLENTLRERIKTQLLPQAKVELTFERRRPPLELNPRQLPVARLAQRLYGEIGKQLEVVDSVAGGGTDAAFAALGHRNPVLERFGLASYGAHSQDNEYVLIDSIAPRLYLASRLIVEFSRGMAK